MLLLSVESEGMEYVSRRVDEWTSGIDVGEDSSQPQTYTPTRLHAYTIGGYMVELEVWDLREVQSLRTSNTDCALSVEPLMVKLVYMEYQTKKELVRMQFHLILDF